MSEFKYLKWFLDKSGTDNTEYRRKMVSGRKVASAFRILVNARCLQLERTRVLYETLLVPVLMYGSETMIWRETGRVCEGGMFGP